MNLSSNNPFVTVPKNVKVLERDSSATFNIKTKLVTSTTTGVITASYGGQSPSASLTVIPVTTNTTITIGETNVTPNVDNGNANLLLAQPVTLAQTGTVQSLSFYVTTAAGNLRLGVYDASGPGGIPGSKKAETASFATTTGWNTVNVITPVSLSAGSYYLAYLPSDNNLTFQKAATGGTSYKFSYAFGTLPAIFSTTPLTTPSHWSLYGTLNVQTSGPVMSSMSVNPTTVTGGTSSQGTVTLSAPAPSSGAVVSLSSTNPSVATGPTSVTVPAGSLTANFTVSTSSVSTSTSVSLSGSYNSVSRSASLTVNPVAPPPDTTPPVISGVSSSGITSNGATITWSTNEASNTQVDYGTTTSYGSTSTLISSLVTAHSTTLSGLSAGTQYHYRVKSRDAAGNLAASGDFTFTTQTVDTTPPVISLVTATSITAVGAVISWTTNEASNSQVDYGPTTAYGSSTVLDSTLLTGHFSTLVTLSASSVYHYRVKSRDAAGNLATSGDFIFTTLALDLTAPVISAVSASGVSSNGANIAWATNESSSSQVDYGTTTSYGSTTVLDSSMVTTHSEGLSSLTPNTLYHYRVKSRDAAGNLATSGDFTVTTSSAGSGTTGDYFVSPTGNDSNPGTQLSPFRTIARGIQALSSGKTLVIMGGIYPERITTAPSGSSWSTATTIKANPGDSVVLKPGSGTFALSVSGSPHQYIIFDGLTLDATGTNNAVVKLTDGANHIRLSNCEIRNSPQAHGVLITDGIGSSSFNELKNCKIHDNGASWIGPVSPPHNIYNSGDDTLIEGCEIYNNPNGFAIHHFSGGDRMIVRNCIIHDTQRDGVLCDGSDDMVYNNVFYNNVGCDVKISDGSGLISGVKVYNNTFYNSGESIRVGIMTSGTTALNCEVINNICWSSADQNWQIRITSDASGTIVKNNLTRNPVSDAGIGTIVTTNMTGDPLFVNITGRDFHLQTGSPAIDHGISLTQVLTDAQGFARPQGGAYDFGAYER